MTKPEEKLIVILWTDFGADCAAAKSKIVSAGHRCLVRNAAIFQESDFEPARAIAFDRAHREQLIRDVYAARGIGVVSVTEDGSIAFEQGPRLSAPGPQPVEQDYLDERLENMTYDDLRTYVRGVTGAEPPQPKNDPPNDEDAEALKALLRKPEPPAAASDSETDVIDSSTFADADNQADTPAPETGKRTRKNKA